MVRHRGPVTRTEIPAIPRPGGSTGGTVLLALALMAGVPANGETGSRGDYPIRPVPFTAVTVADGFWSPRLETNRTVTVRYDFQKCERTGRVSNFSKAGGLETGDFEGLFGFNDSDVYKVVEGASYALSLQPDAELEHYVDDLAVKIAAAQEDDGYLYTAGTIGALAEDPICCVSRPRWADLKSGHELYNLGHFYEAAVAHFQATGKRTLLDVALRSADLLTTVFGPGRNMGVPGHQEVEIGLVKLYRATGERKYLDLARFFLDQRGNPAGHELYGAYNQDHEPVIEQTEAVGHAVRAAYMYSGMADVGALAGDQAYVDALGRLWDNVVGRKLYLTGGIGARHEGEAFGDDYELPNRTAYAETCAAIANAMWNHRLFLLHGDARYLDVLERVIYNGVLSGVSLDGEHFFYPNPLASDGRYAFNQGATGRKGWFDCSCCPTNLVRFLPSIAGYVYAQRERDLFVNLFVAGSAEMDLEGRPVRVRQETRYPWDGRVAITLEPERAEELTLHVRIPGWARGRPVPSDLYRYVDDHEEPIVLAVNGEPHEVELVKGFAAIRRTWEKGDTVELTLPMRVRRVVSHDKVQANAGRVALERGPVVYCAEGVDNGGKVFNLVLPDDAPLEAQARDGLLGGVTVIEGRALGLSPAEDGRSVVTKERDFVAVPYYAWAHRGEGEMAVWLPRRVQLDFRVP
ncbi:MAG: glycoside hydrolase family 127 protein [Acidobacteria bacterium]|nr:glycoside hydrolase family 127 protein [Acidobacteriota bacterium]